MTPLIAQAERKRGQIAPKDETRRIAAVFGRYPILAHQQSEGTVQITVDHPIGRQGKRKRFTIKVQDHARRWYKLTFPNVRNAHQPNA